MALQHVRRRFLPSSAGTSSVVDRSDWANIPRDGPDQFVGPRGLAPPCATNPYQFVGTRT